MMTAHTEGWASLGSPAQPNTEAGPFHSSQPPREEARKARWPCPLFTGKRVAAQRGEEACPRSHSEERVRISWTWDPLENECGEGSRERKSLA